MHISAAKHKPPPPSITTGSRFRVGEGYTHGRKRRVPIIIFLTSSVSRHLQRTSRMGRLATTASRRLSIGRATTGSPPSSPPHLVRGRARTAPHLGCGRTAPAPPTARFAAPPRTLRRHANGESGALSTAAAVEDAMTVRLEFSELLPAAPAGVSHTRPNTGVLNDDEHAARRRRAREWIFELSRTRRDLKN